MKKCEADVSNRSSRKKYTCSKCGKSIRGNHLERHMKKCEADVSNRSSRKKYAC